MDDHLIDLYHRHVGRAFERQRRLAELLAKQPAGGEIEYDPATAAFTYGRLAFEAPIVGTHTPTDSWLWATANKHLRLTLTNRALVDAARSVVHRLGVHALGAPAFPLEPLVGSELLPSAAHVLGTVLSGELGYDAFHTFPHDNGRELVLIRDERLKVAEKKPLLRVATTFPVAVREMVVPDHKAALSAYARSHGLTVAEGAGVLTVTGTGKDVLTATFDPAGRLAKLEGVAVPLPPAPKPGRKKAAVARAGGKAPKAGKPAKAAGKKPVAKKAAAKTTTAKKPVGKAKPAGKAKAKPAGKKR